MMKLLLLLLNAAKLKTILTSGGAMLLSIITYSFLFGWRYAVGIVVLILIHELGHFFAMKQIGLRPNLPVIIPFVGWTSAEGEIKDGREHAYIALAGPVIGTLGALVCYAAAMMNESRLLYAIAYSGFMLNLFNLMPIRPFDGGHVVAVLSPRIWLLGIPMLAALAFFMPSPMIFLIILLALPSAWSAWTGSWREHVPEGYYEQPNAVKIQYGGAYLAMAGFLAVMAYQTYLHLGPASRATPAEVRTAQIQPKASPASTTTVARWVIG